MNTQLYKRKIPRRQQPLLRRRHPVTVGLTRTRFNEHNELSDKTQNFNDRNYGSTDHGPKFSHCNRNSKLFLFILRSHYDDDTARTDVNTVRDLLDRYRSKVSYDSQNTFRTHTR